MISELKPKLNPVISIIAKPFSKISPNILSFLGLIPPFVFLALMLNGQFGWALLAFPGLLFDTIDGAVARMTNKSTAFGGLLDSTLDRIADSIFIFAFALAGLVPVGWAFTLLVLSFLISYIRSRAELAGNSKFVLNVGWIERPERLIGLFIALAGYVLLKESGQNWPTLMFIVLSLLSFITVIQRMVRSAKLLK